MAYRLTTKSSDGSKISTNSEPIFELWDRIGKEMQADENNWTETLRAMRVKMAHPDDGHVKRDADEPWVSPAYPSFNDSPKVGDLIALGCPAEDSHYEPSRESEYEKPRQMRAVRKPESAYWGYRICKVTKIENKWGNVRYYYEDTRMRVPNRAPRLTWIQKLILRARY